MNSIKTSTIEVFLLCLTFYFVTITFHYSREKTMIEDFPQTVNSAVSTITTGDIYGAEHILLSLGIFALVILLAYFFRKKIDHYLGKNE